MSKSLYQSNLNFTYDTFAGLVTRVNQISYDMFNSVITTNSSAVPDITNGNAYVNGSFGASIVYVTGSLQGGTGNTPATLNVISSVSISNSVIIQKTLAVNSTITATNNISAPNATVNTIIFNSANVGGGSLTSTNYSGTSNNSNNLGGLSLANIQSQISGNATTAFNNAVSTSYFTAANSLVNGAIVVANAVYANNTGSVDGYPLSLNAPQDQFIMTWSTSSNAVIFKSPSSISFPVSSNNVVANLSLSAGYNGSAYTLYVNTTYFGVASPNVNITSSSTLNFNAPYAQFNNSLGVSGNVYTQFVVFSGGNYISNTFYSGISNNSYNLGGTSLGTIQSQISGNAATSYSNAISYVGSNFAPITNPSFLGTVTVTGVGLTTNSAFFQTANGYNIGQTGWYVASAPQQGGRIFENGHDLNAYPQLYSASFVNINTAQNVPSNPGFSGNGYRFVFGAGDTSNRGFELVGTTGSGVALFFRCREFGNTSWQQLVTINTASTISATATNSLNLGGASLGTIQSQISGNAASTYASAIANAGGKILLNTLTFNNSTSVSDLSSFTGAYRYYDIICEEIVFASSQNSGNYPALGIQFSNNGSNFITASAYYAHSWFNDAGNNYATSTSSISYGSLGSPHYTVSAGSTVYYSTITITGSQQSNYRMGCRTVAEMHNAYGGLGWESHSTTGYTGSPFNLRGVNIFCPWGNVSTGTVRIYGYN